MVTFWLYEKIKNCWVIWNPSFNAKMNELTKSHRIWSIRIVIFSKYAVKLTTCLTTCRWVMAPEVLKKKKRSIQTCFEAGELQFGQARMLSVAGSGTENPVGTIPTVSKSIPPPPPLWRWNKYPQNYNWVSRYTRLILEVWNELCCCFLLDLEMKIPSKVCYQIFSPENFQHSSR